VIKPVIDVHKVHLAHPQFRDGTVHDSLGQRQECRVVMLSRNKVNHRITSHIATNLAGERHSSAARRPRRALDPDEP
jgi:hypothetical protein